MLNLNNYDLAYKYYLKAIDIHPNKKKVAEDKFPNIIYGLIEDINIATTQIYYLLIILFAY